MYHHSGLCVVLGIKLTALCGLDQNSPGIPFEGNPVQVESENVYLMLPLLSQSFLGGFTFVVEL